MLDGSGVKAKVAEGKFATFLTPFQASIIRICLQVKSSFWYYSI